MDTTYLALILLAFAYMFQRLLALEAAVALLHKPEPPCTCSINGSRSATLTQTTCLRHGTIQGFTRRGNISGFH